MIDWCWLILAILLSGTLGAFIMAQFAAKGQADQCEVCSWKSGKGLPFGINVRGVPENNASEWPNVPSWALSYRDYLTHEEFEAWAAATTLPTDMVRWLRDTRAEDYGERQ